MPSFDGKSILVVDDDPEILTALKTAFEDTGAAIQTAADGNKAVELAETGDLDLVVLDALLPKRSGFLVLERLKSKKAKGNRPYIIMITANEGKRHKAWAESLGVDEYLNKPFPMERLMDSAQRLLTQ